MSAKHSASIIAIGSEMLGPTRVDTNSLKVTAAFESFGIGVVRKSVVGDTQDQLVDEIRHSLEHSDILITSGGLGPTEDDMTREALAEALGLTMEVDAGIIERLEKRFAARGWVMPEVNKRQANVFVGQTTLTNERGTAPGFHIEHDGKHVWVFPGVPHELEWMVTTYLTPWLASTTGGQSRFRRVLKIAGMTESGVEERLKTYYAAHPEPLTILATSGQTELHLAADGAESEALALIAAREAELRELFAHKIFGVDDDTLEAVVGRMLTERGETVATAESCTGGLLASRITDVPGSSAYFMGGAVCYTAAAKIDLARVDPAIIAEHGEVSEPVAIALARGARERFGTTYGIGVTGIAGPGGGTEAKPVGTVHIAVAGADAHKHWKLLWPMERSLFKRITTQSALDLLRLFIVRT
ncbi:MAG: competence/damage-inducible protein A [Acidobacteria bacterium]|nr:competence/damage-inducible protein A [Acidobacteriota bacterium]MBV9070874.1 competence/damage-inducible protein A [Acidobacteriota bacterium]MBV9186240.1 competence/damage-inducible protein A [Acidobacteriota bacterium]